MNQVHQLANALAVDALQEARGMPPGAQRTNALKKAGLLCFDALRTVRG
jgi:hypothetical protein